MDDMDDSVVKQYAKCFVAVGTGTESVYLKTDIETAKGIIDLLKTNNIQKAAKKISDELTRAKKLHTETDTRQIARAIQQIAKL